MRTHASRVLHTDAGPRLSTGIHRAIRQERGRGRPLEPAVRAGAERAFGYVLGDVRVHTGAVADRLSASLHATAFTARNDVFFRAGAYQPGSARGSHLLAHELSHVLQHRLAGRSEHCSAAETVLAGAPGDAHERAADRAAEAAAPVVHLASAGGAAAVQPEMGAARVGGVPVVLGESRPPPAVQRDLAISPTHPDAAAPVLTDDEVAVAVAYNAARFHDPFTISFVRDVLGVPRYPAVSDRDLAIAAARYQVSFGLEPDGRIGPATTRRLVAELNAEDQRRLARLLREDNLVTWTSALGPTWTGCGTFDWNVNFTTTLRGGWLIQRIDNTWNATACGPGGGDVTPAFTRQYWEAWWVDGNGRVLLPTSLANPPATAVPAPAHDLWHNPPIPGSHGNWSQAGMMFTTLTLPAGFAIHGANSAPESIDLPSTRGPVAADDLGLNSGSRRVAGEWDCCDPDPARHFHRAR